MKRSIFISRDLAPNSHLLAYLTRHQWTVHHRSLIRTEPIPFQIPDGFDWWFFSSSNGATTVLQTCRPGTHIRIGAVGAATAATLKGFGVEPHFVGNSGNMDEVGRQLAAVVGQGSILFLGAEGGSQRVRHAIAAEQQRFVAVYRTILVEDAEIPETDTVFLTSPSNAEAYLTVRPLVGRTIIAIGHTTADFLQARGLQHVLMPKTPTEADVVELLRRLEG